ncbi:MAG: NADPH-dependent F420 reductase [Flavobacteriales bacterium]
MKIAIIGTGNIGGTLARKWHSAGHSIILGARNKDTFKGKELLDLDGVQVATIPDAVQKSDVILLATPAPLASEIAQSLGDTTGKIIIDAMNVVMGKGPDGFTNSAEAILANKLTRDVVKCFNTTGFNNIENPVYGEEVIEMYMAGDSARGKEVAHQLALDAGFSECIDVGGNNRFELMEQFAFFWINLAMMQGHGRNIAFKLLKRD